MSECLAENVVVEFLDGKLGVEATAAVERHVDECSDCRQLLAEATRDHFDVGTEPTRTQGGAAAATTPPLADGALLRRGATVGRYVILSPIGAGGMGVVYAAYDPELDRKIALKLLRTGSWQQTPDGLVTMRTRLQREAQAMARVSHPAVIAVYDVGTFGEQVFVAMEFVDGGTLTQWLWAARPTVGEVLASRGAAHHRPRPRPWREVLGRFLLAGRGLQAAHEAGLVHRDFKPDNVLVGRDGRVCVTDFGLARPLATPRALPDTEKEPDPEHPPSSLAHDLTRTGALVGTPAYMAPEQLDGEPTDARSDLFSFCVALYEGLHGERPFVADSFDELRRAIEGQRLREPPPGTRVPAWLRRVLVRGLRVRPDDRFPSMAALLDALDREARPRWRWAALAGGLTLIAMLAVGYRYLSGLQGELCRGGAARLEGVWDAARKESVHRAFTATGKPYAEDAWRGVERALDRYGASWAAMHVEACEATRVSGEQSDELLDLRMSCLGQRRRELEALVGLFGDADAVAVEHAVEAAARLPVIDACANIAALRTPLPPPRDPQVRVRIEELQTRLAEARALREAGRYPRALEIATAAATAARPLGHRPLEAECDFLVGDLDDRSSRFADAEASLRAAVVSAQAGRHDAVAAAAMSALVRVTGYRRAQPEQGLLWGQLARATLERMGGDPRAEATLLSDLGVLHRARGQYREAQTVFEQALALRERHLGGEHLDVASSLAEVGLIVRDQGKYELSLTFLRRALELRERLLGGDHPLVASSLSDVADVEQRRGRYVEARAMAERSLAIREKALGPDHLDVGYSTNRLGTLHLAAGDVDDAIRYYRRTVGIGERVLGPRHPELAMACSNLSAALLAAGHVDEASVEASRALRILEATVGGSHHYTAMVLNRVGDIESAQGRFADALGHHRRALAVDEKALDADHPELASSLTGIGVALLGLRTPVPAVVPLERAERLRRPDRDGAPAEMATTRFALGRALWDAGGDRARAHQLVAHAQTDLAGLRNGHQALRREIAAWLALHVERG